MRERGKGAGWKMAEQALSPVDVAPQTSQALRAFSEVLDEIKLDMSEGTYLRVCEAAMKLHKAKRMDFIDAPAQGARSVALDNIREQVDSLINELQNESDDLQGQLALATVTIDRLRERRDFFSRGFDAISEVLELEKIDEKILDDALERHGILHRFQEERKRKREESDSGESDDESDAL